MQIVHCVPERMPGTSGAGFVRKDKPHVMRFIRPRTSKTRLAGAVGYERADQR
jgi:hypothetical protein